MVFCKTLNLFFIFVGADVSFFVGGGCFCCNTAVQLLIGGHTILSAKGRCHERMTKQIWNLQHYIGRKARLRLVDFSSGVWGHISFDDFRGNVSMCRGKKFIHHQNHHHYSFKHRLFNQRFSNQL